MNEYNVSDYGIFSDAIATTNSLNEKVNDAKSVCSECESVLGDEAIFMGPAAEGCGQLFSELNNSISTITNNFTSISQYLAETSASYQAGDTKALKNISNLDLPNSTGGSSSLVSNYKGAGGASASQVDFINSIKDGAVDAYNKYGVLPSLTLAQAALESGWGESAIGNNIFGIKAGSGWKGKTQNVLTTEQNPDGSSYQKTDDFRDYDSISDSIVDHAELLSTDRYQSVRNSKNYKDACRTVKECGYATDTAYTDKLINIIETYDLAQWDPKK